MQPRHLHPGSATQLMPGAGHGVFRVTLNFSCGLESCKQSCFCAPHTMVFLADSTSRQIKTNYTSTQLFLL